jgi:hypothetical protein
MVAKLLLHSNTFILLRFKNDGLTWEGINITHVSSFGYILYPFDSIFLEYFLSRILSEYISGDVQGRCEDNLEDVAFNPFANNVFASVNVLGTLIVEMIIC